VAIHRHQSYADAVRDALGRLEAAGLRWYLTGSEALGPYAEPRQTADTDVVVDLPVERFDPIFASFADAYAVARPIRVTHRWLASLVSLDGWGKLDIVLRDPGPWAGEALERRRRFDHPGYGLVWLSSPEDLLLAKLEWSEGTSELQLRDCANLLRANPGLDAAYLDRHAADLGVSALLAKARADVA
jgi:hypothetical protein